MKRFSIILSRYANELLGKAHEKDLPSASLHKRLRVYTYIYICTHNIKH